MIVEMMPCGAPRPQESRTAVKHTKTQTGAEVSSKKKEEPKSCIKNVCISTVLGSLWNGDQRDKNEAGSEQTEGCHL